MDQLKSQWGVIKMAAKKNKVQVKTFLNKTEDGNHSPISPSEAEDIVVWVAPDIKVDTNEFESDAFRPVSTYFWT